MGEGLIKTFLRKENIFAVVGVSRDKKKYGCKVYKNLKDAGYKVYPINPNIDKIDGEKCYPSLSKLPEKPNIVDTVVPPAVTEKTVKECKKLGIKRVWMQPGSESEKTVNFCKENNIEVIYNVCVMLERKRVFKVLKQKYKMDEEEEKLKKEKTKKLMEETEKVQIEIEVNDSNFEEEIVERSKKIPVVVDFWAEWCKPCLMLSPILEKLVKEYNGKFALAKVNVDGAQIASQKYGIMSIPNVKLFKDGKVADEFVGAYPENFIREWLNKNL